MNFVSPKQGQPEGNCCQCKYYSYEALGIEFMQEIKYKQIFAVTIIATGVFLFIFFFFF